MWEEGNRGWGDSTPVCNTLYETVRWAGRGRPGRDGEVGCYYRSPGEGGFSHISAGSSTGNAEREGWNIAHHRRHLRCARVQRRANTEHMIN